MFAILFEERLGKFETQADIAFAFHGVNRYRLRTIINESGKIRVPLL
jgi:hypothetical protein